MTSNDLHFTMRQLQRHVRSPLLWASLAAAAFVLGLAGPFSTFQSIALAPRLAYWGFVVVSTYFIGLGTIVVLERILAPGGSVMLYAAFGAVAGLPVGLFVWGVNAVVFGPGAVALLPLIAYTVAIAAAASGLISAFMSAAGPAGRETTAAPMRSALVGRLPVELRGRLSHLSVQDHYVEVHTDKGRHLLLMRLSDAILETGDAAGLQIHRSHWVAHDAVARSERRNGRLYVVLVDGTVLPVSRNNIAAVREAGLA